MPAGRKACGLRFPKKEKEAVGCRLFFPQPGGEAWDRGCGFEGLRGVLFCPRF